VWRRVLELVREAASEIAWILGLVTMNPTAETRPIGVRGALHFWKIYGNYPDWLWRILWHGQEHLDLARWRRVDPPRYWEWLHARAI